MAKSKTFDGFKGSGPQVGIDTISTKDLARKDKAATKQTIVPRRITNKDR